MPIVEGTPALPKDSLGNEFAGILDDQGNFWAPRSDAQHSLRVALWSPSGAALLTQANPGIISSAGSNLLILDQQFVFTPATGANTPQTLDVNQPAYPNPTALTYLAITNPSTASAMTITFSNKEVFRYSGVDDIRYVPVSNVTVAANSVNGQVYIVQGWLLGEGGRITINNNSTTEGSTVTVKFKVRKV